MQSSYMYVRNLVPSRRVSWKVAQFRNFEWESFGREESSIWFYHAADLIFLPISLVLIVEDLCPTWFIARCNTLFHNADYPNRSRKPIYNALRDVSRVGISFFGLIIETFLW